MKRYILLLFAVLPLFVQGQVPQWTQASFREQHYPPSEWYVGFSRDRLRAGENVGTALRNLERDAQNQLTESIIVTIDGETQTQIESRQRQAGGQISEVITTDYRQIIRTATTATTVRMETRSHHNPATGMLYAFAAVRRADLAAFYTSQINLDLNRVENDISVSEELVRGGRRMSAHRRIAEAQQTLNAVSFQRSLLVAVDARNADERTLQTHRYNNLQRTIQQLLIYLTQRTFVYVECRHENRGNPTDDVLRNMPPDFFCGIIKQAITENDASITDSPDEADFILTLITSTTMRSDGSGQWGIITYYANVRGTLFNRHTQRQVVSFTIFNDADAYDAGRTPEDAATRAFRLPELRDNVLRNVLPRIRD